MIRSLVAPNTPDNDDPTIRRNLDIAQLTQAIDDGCLLWLDLVEPEQDEVTWLAEQFNLNPAVVEDVQREDRRPTLMVYPQYLFVSLFEPHVVVDQAYGREIHCLITDKCFITLRKSDAETVENAYNRVAQNPDSWQSGVAYFFYLTAQYVMDSYYPLLDRISNHLNKFEEKLMDGRYNDPSRNLVYRIKKQLIKLRQMVAPQREVFSSVIGEKRLREHTGIRDLFHHLYERLLRVYDIIDSQRDLASNVLDMIQNQESRRLVEAVNRLTIFSMIFLPLTFFTGLFELNFTTTSEPFVLPLNGSVIFMMVIVSMVLSAGFMIYSFRRRGWL